LKFRFRNADKDFIRIFAKVKEIIVQFGEEDLEPWNKAAAYLLNMQMARFN